MTDSAKQKATCRTVLSLAQLLEQQPLTTPCSRESTSYAPYGRLRNGSGCSNGMFGHPTDK
jgi:hypothetical protein